MLRLFGNIAYYVEFTYIINACNRASGRKTGQYKVSENGVGSIFNLEKLEKDIVMMKHLQDVKKNVITNFKKIIIVSLIAILTSVVLAKVKPLNSLDDNKENSPSINKSASKITSIFNNAKPVSSANIENVCKMSLKDLTKSWYQLPVSQGGGMFNPVFMPFKYVCKAGNKDVNQHMTFPCLLSFKFDFVPDNFSARHPAYIYRKSSVWNVKPHETDKIAHYIEYWEATHAIGGTIRQNADGYTGLLQVFDESGTEILSQEYTKPLPYFTLMGEMVKTWMDHRNQGVSEGLYTELIRPMTTDMECVKLYGQSFHVKWRRAKEWAIYDEILQRDPNFAEVRFWYANQLAWTLDEDDAKYIETKTEKGRALQSHLVISALREFEFEKCPDKKVVNNFRKVLNYAERLCSDNSTVMSVKLRLEGKQLSIEELDDLLPIAEKYPSSWNFIVSLGSEYRRRGCYEKSMPLYLSAINSGYLKGVGRFDWEWNRLAPDFYDLGYPDESLYCAIQAIQNCSEKEKPYIFWNFGKAYKERNHFKIAAGMFRYREELKTDGYGNRFARLSVYQDGDLSLLSELEDLSASNHTSSLESARDLIAKGMYDQAISKLSTYLEMLRSKRNSYLHKLEAEIICSDLYLLSGDLENAKKHAICAWYISPRSRQVGYLLERSCVNDSETMELYAKVLSFTCNEDLFLKSVSANNRKWMEEVDRNIAMNLYNKTQSKLKSISKEEESGFWQQCSPFEVEYICISLLKTCDLEKRNEILDFYLRYRNTIKLTSKWQKKHTRIFFIQLLDLIPESERPKYISKLNI